MEVHFLEYHEAAKLRKEWEEKGSPPCNHSQIEQRFLGQYAGDYACTNCGITFLSPTFKMKEE